MSNGFGVCFEMGKKCSKMPTLYIPSLCTATVCGNMMHFLSSMNQPLAEKIDGGKKFRS